MNFLKKNGAGLLLCLSISVLAWFLGKAFPVIGGPVFAILIGMTLTLIVMAMAAIGLNTNVIHLVKTGAKPIFTGFCCWVGISLVSLGMQHMMGIW